MLNRTSKTPFWSPRRSCSRRKVALEIRDDVNGNVLPWTSTFVHILALWARLAWVRINGLWSFIDGEIKRGPLVGGYHIVFNARFKTAPEITCWHESQKMPEIRRKQRRRRFRQALRQKRQPELARKFAV